MANYYNEIHPHAAQWLRNLIDAGHIAPGVVDERSIEDVHPDDLDGFTQCHFFAGVGVWSLALRRAGWPDSRPIWTGSCPCQPFSTAGQGDGFADERHLWPPFFHLIEKRRPPAVIGEQVASKDANAWVDLVQDDMEALDYPFGAIPFPSASVGAPHMRDRLYWFADGRLENASRERRHRLQVRVCGRGPQQDSSKASWRGAVGWLGDAERDGLRSGRRPATDVVDEPSDRPVQAGAMASTGPVNGLWRDADWLLCRDGKWRPVEPGTCPLADGSASSVGRLRAYGNAINAYQAQVFIEAVMETTA